MSHYYSLCLWLPCVSLSVMYGSLRVSLICISLVLLLLLLRRWFTAMDLSVQGLSSNVRTDSFAIAF